MFSYVLSDCYVMILCTYIFFKSPLAVVPETGLPKFVIQYMLAKNLTLVQRIFSFP